MDLEIPGTAVMTPAGAHALVKGLTPLTKYLASDLYRRYQAQCQQAGVLPASPIAVGKMLKHIGCTPVKKGTGKGTRSAWLVTYTAQRAEWADGRWV